MTTTQATGWQPWGARDALRRAADQAAFSGELRAIEQLFRSSGLPELSEDFFPEPVRPAIYRTVEWTPVVLMALQLVALFLDRQLGIPSSWVNLYAAVFPIAMLVLYAIRLDFDRRGIPRSFFTWRRLARRPPMGRFALAVMAMYLAPVALNLVLFVIHGEWVAVAVLCLIGVAVVITMDLALMGYFNLGLYLFRAAIRGVRAIPAVAAAMPLMMAVVFLAFLNQSAWSVLGGMHPAQAVAATLVIGGVAVGILVMRARPTYKPLQAPEWDDASELLARETPVRALLDRGWRPARPLPKLSRRTRANVAGAVVLSLAGQILAATIGLSVGLIALGALLVGPSTTEAWTGAHRHIWSATLGGGLNLTVSVALIQVCVLLGALAALYFVAVSLGQADLRTRFMDPEAARLRPVIAGWPVYESVIGPARSRFVAAADGNTPATG